MEVALVEAKDARINDLHSHISFSCRSRTLSADLRVTLPLLHTSVLRVPLPDPLNGAATRC